MVVISTHVSSRGRCPRSLTKALGRDTSSGMWNTTSRSPPNTTYTSGGTRRYRLSATRGNTKIMQCITGCLQHSTTQKLCSVLQAVCSTIQKLCKAIQAVYNTARHRNYAVYYRLSAIRYRNYAKHNRLSATQYDTEIMQSIAGCLQQHT